MSSCGYLDFVEPFFVYGWAELEGYCCEVSLFVNGEQRRFKREEILRKDLEEYGYSPKSGFKLNLSEGLIDGDNVRVVFPSGIDIEGSPRTYVRRQPIQQKNPLLFCHVPKTGGTSLRKYLENQTQRLTKIYSDEPLSGKAPQMIEEADPDIVFGHYSFGVHNILGVAPRYCTVLRDPVERVISLYRFSDFYTQPSVSNYFSSKPKLCDLIESAVSEQTNNHMCRIISGIESRSCEVINERWLLDHALHNIKHYFEIVGVQDHLGDVAARLSKILGLSLGTPIPLENVNTSPMPELSKTDLLTLRHHNSLDLELYVNVYRDYCKLMKVGGL